MIQFRNYNKEIFLAEAEIKYKEAVNGEKSLSGTIYTNSDVINNIDKGWALEWQNKWYFITYVQPVETQESITIEFDAVHEFFYKMGKSVVYGKLKDGSHTAKEYFDYVFNGSGYSYLFKSDINAFEKQSFGDKNRLSLFNDLVSSTGMEFSISDNDQIVIAKEIGRDLSTIVRTGFNLQELKLEYNIGDFVTYGRAFGAFKDKDDESKGRYEAEYTSTLANVFGKLEADPIVDERFTDEQALKDKLIEAVDNSYSISVNISLVDLQRAGYEYDSPIPGDYILVVDDRIGFKQRIRIISIDESYNVLGERIDISVTAGSLSATGKKLDGSADNDTDIKLGDMNDQINNVAESADGKNRNFYGPNEPVNPKEGDLWYYDNGSGTSFMKQFINGDWVTLVDSNTGKRIDDAQEDATEAKNKANDAVSKANDAVANAGFAQDTANNAKSDATDALSKAGDAFTNADKALDDINKLDQTVKTEISNINGQLSQKVSQITFDDLKKTVTTQGTEIDQNKNDIALKANQTTVDQIDGTVKQLDAELKIQGDQITSKVSRNDVTGMLSGYATQTWTQSQIKQTADEIYLSVSKVKNETEIQFSQLQVTINGIQGTVSGKADQSQVTQLANQITSTVNGIGTTNLVSNSEFENGLTTNWIFINPTYWDVGVNQYDSYMGSNALHFRRTSAQGTSWMNAGADWIPVYAGQKVSASVIAYQTGPTGDGWTPTGTFKVEIDFYTVKGGDRTEFHAGNAFDVTKPYERQTLQVNNITVPSGANFARFHIQTDGTGNMLFAHPMMTKKETALPYTPGTISQSQITQLEDNINLRVQKNDVVNQINVSSEGILIAGNKIHITGQTFIDSAVIKSAMIADISADKITAGTINAANVNLINMNASNITTGTIKGASLSINLLNGNVTFQKGRIYSTTGTIDMNIDQGYLSVTNATGGNQNNVLIRNGEIAFTQPQLFDPSKDPYLRISNKIGESAFNSSTIQARSALELNIKGHESSLIDMMGVQTLAGIKFGIGNSNKLEPTFIGGADVGVIISGGTITNSGYFDGSPSISIGTSGGKPNNEIHIDSEWIRLTAAYDKTTSAGSNVYVEGDGTLMRSTSASKYKQNIIRNVDLSDSEKLLNIPLARWDDKAEVRRTGTSKRYFGMIAEDLAAAGLEYLVDRGPNGEIEGIEYSKVALLLIPEVKKLRNKIEMLEQQNGGNIA